MWVGVWALHFLSVILLLSTWLSTSPSSPPPLPPPVPMPVMGATPYPLLLLTETCVARLKFGPGDLFLLEPVGLGVAFCPDVDPFLFLRLLGARWVSVLVGREKRIAGVRWMSVMQGWGLCVGTGCSQFK